VTGYSKGEGNTVGKVTGV